MTKKVLITRPRDQAEEFAATVTACGAVPFFAPLLDIRKVPHDIGTVPRVDALVITSRNAMPDVFPDQWVSLPVYCVGAATAKLYRANGGQGLIDQAEDASHLLPRLRESPQASFLYLRGVDITENIAAQLPHKICHEIITYRADSINVLPPEIAGQFASLDIVTFFSGRTAAAFSDIVTGTPFMEYLSHMTALSLSDKVLNSVHHLGWKQMLVAPKPDIDGMAQALKQLVS